MIPFKPLSAESVITLPETSGRMFIYQFLQLLYDSSIILLLILILEAAAWQADHFTRLTNAQHMLLGHALNQLALLIRR